MARVAFEDVGKVYPGGARAVSDFDLDVEDGEFMVLVGPRAAARPPPCAWSRASRTSPRGPSASATGS